MPKGNFDVRGFFAAVDKERDARSLTWKKVADQTEVSASSLTRMANGSGLDVDGLVTLADWAGLNLDDFARGGTDQVSSPDRMTEVVTYLRADPDLSEESAAYLESLITTAYEMVKKRDSGGA